MLELRNHSCPDWLTRNLYMNDVYVWKLLLHAAALAARDGVEALPPFVDAELRAFNVSRLAQAWFAYNWRLQKKAFYPFVEPNATSYTTPFDLREYIVHHILSGPYSKAREKSRKLLRRNKTATVIGPSIRSGSSPPSTDPHPDSSADIGGIGRQNLRECTRNADGGGLSMVECAHVLDFVQVLVGHDACYNEAASEALRQEVVEHFSIKQRWQWQSVLNSPRSRAARESSLKWLTLSAGVPCDATTRKWWVPGSSHAAGGKSSNESAASTRWAAMPEWAHANNKAPSVALCPGRLLRMDTSPCKSKADALSPQRRCHDDALPLCEPFLFGSRSTAEPEKLASSPSTCLVYSFGIGGEWSFEDWMSRRCEVHAFDPTKRLRRRHEQYAAGRRPNLTFHYAGLGVGAGGSAASLVSGTYGALDSQRIKPLSALMQESGHIGRQIDMLKIDCEGCEWESFNDIAVRTPTLLQKVCTIVLEVHVATQLQMGSQAQLRLMAAFWRHYIVEAGFRIWYVHRNTGNPLGVDSHVHPLLVTLGMDEAVCCFEIGLHRPGCGTVSQ